MDDQLHIFVKQAFDQGQTIEQIRSELLSVGWDESLIREAIHDVMSMPMINRGFAPVSDSPKQVQQSQVQQINGVKQNPTTFKNVKSVTMAGKRIDDPRHPQIIRSFQVTGIATGIIIALTGIGVIGGTVYYYTTSTNSSPLITKTEIQKNSPVDATDTQMVRYKNEGLGFLMDKPRTWSVKEYPDGVYGLEKRIAFGETRSLPQTEFKQGNYGWIKIFPISDSKNYSNFLELGAVIGKDPQTKLYRLDGKPGVLHKDFVAVEYRGYVYEIHLPVKNSLQGEPFTEESEAILNSFRFLE